MAGAETTAPAAIVTKDRPREPARLVVVFPPELAASLPLDGERVRVGRALGESADLEVAHPTVSRLHITVTWDRAARRHLLVDEGSKNGTWVGGARLTRGSRVLGHGTVIRLGDTVLVYERGAALDAPDAGEVSRESVPGVSLAARLLRISLAKAGPDPAPVLLEGETGTGKEHLARELHRLSGRKGPFLAVSCAELTGELTESRLFGHARGAFTGAASAQPGLLRSAAGGTLLLDEIGELSPALQPKLLRTLQENEVLPVGEVRPVAVDVRVVAATHRDLDELVAAGSFRRDLHARLAFWRIVVPPLRARRADLPIWLARLHARFAERRPGQTAAPPTFTADAIEAMLLAEWPDNLRGLDQLVLRVAGGTSPVTRADLGPMIVAEEPSDEVAETDDAPRPPPPATREELAAALAQHGNVYALARFYGRDRRQIYRWLKSFGLK